jgi:hypothetical protein
VALQNTVSSSLRSSVYSLIRVKHKLIRVQTISWQPCVGFGFRSKLTPPSTPHTKSVTFCSSESGHLCWPLENMDPVNMQGLKYHCTAYPLFEGVFRGVNNPQCQMHGNCNKECKFY